MALPSSVTDAGTPVTEPGRNCALGLSPRVRGNLERHQRVNVAIGSIPARAGEPMGASRESAQHRVYPRACGGTLNTRTFSAMADGLSPRVRGNHGIQNGLDICSGSIPARAGEPNPLHVVAVHYEVYPRACGGTTFEIYERLPELGLSPRVRGNPIRIRGNVPRTGSIPARAGEPVSNLRPFSVVWVYPRACGGTALPSTRRPRSGGLSPRVRGNPGRAPGPGRDGGSIPARAGEPTARSPRASPSTVYPRACGGTPRMVMGIMSCPGLSPRVRGNRLCRADPLGAIGSIPARAGEPSSRTG